MPTYPDKGACNVADPDPLFDDADDGALLSISSNLLHDGRASERDPTPESHQERFMTHYVIVGNGVAGVEAALTIRARHRPDRARITIISEETDYFFSRTALMYAFMDQMRRRDLEPYERKMYDKQSIELVRGRVVDLDADAAKLELDDGSEIEFVVDGVTPNVELDLAEIQRQMERRCLSAAPAMPEPHQPSCRAILPVPHR